MASDDEVAELLRRKAALMQDECAEQLKAWTCSKCGAALPRKPEDSETVACAYCGSVFRLPRPREHSGGVQINGSTITVGGDVIGGDRIVIVSDGTIDRLFESLLVVIKDLQPDTLRAEARQQITDLRDQAKCYQPDLAVSGRSLKWLMSNASSLVPKLCETFANPCLPQTIRELAVVLLVD